MSLDVAVDASTITLLIESPLDSFLGFERAPRTNAERKLVNDLTTRLNAAEQLFQISPAAECKLTKVELESEVLGLGEVTQGMHSNHTHTAKGEDDHAHDDMRASIVFTCEKIHEAQHIEVQLFDDFKRLQNIDVQVASPHGQFKRNLRPGTARLPLTR